MTNQNTPYRDPQLIHAGKGYGIMHSIWGRFQDIIQYGSSLVDADPTVLSPLNRTYREEYLNLISVEPKIADMIADVPLADLARQLDKGRNEIRNSQVYSISERISSWGIGVPEEKYLRGFGDNVCGRLLCPSTQEWEDPTVRQQIRSFEIHVAAEDFPKFLWEGEQVDPRDMNKGFLRGDLLVKVLQSLLISPSIVRPSGQSTGAGGNADILNVRHITVPLLAFSATLARYALSSERQCRWTHDSNRPGFSNITFYQQITNTVQTWKEEDRQALLRWWDRMILSHIRGSAHALSLNDAPTPGSAAAIMMQQAANAATGDP